VILGFHGRVKELCTLQEFYAAWNGSFVQTFRKNLSGPIFKGQAVQESFLTHEEGSDI